MKTYSQPIPTPFGNVVIDQTGGTVLFFGNALPEIRQGNYVAFESLTAEPRCDYCDRKNDADAYSCQGCGAPL